MPKYDIWIRHFMDEQTLKFVAGIDPESLDVFEVSGNAWHDLFKWKSYTTKEYPEFDVCKTKFDQSYDLIIAEQVLEHVRYPWAAVQNMYDGLRPGGHILITTPFLFHLHPTPLDCWRWTPQGLGFMLEDAGFAPENIKTDGWGNYEVFLHHAMTQTAPAYHLSQPMHNIAIIPVVVWGFAKK